MGATLEQRNIMIQKRRRPTQTIDTAASVDFFFYFIKTVEKLPIIVCLHYAGQCARCLTAIALNSHKHV